MDILGRPDSTKNHPKIQAKSIDFMKLIYFLDF